VEATPAYTLACNGKESACLILGRTAQLGRDDLLVARLSPAIPAPGGALEEVALAPREPGGTLLPLPQDPTPVYVCQLQRYPSGVEALVVVAWGDLRPADGTMG
jgi:hypothetical protein